MVVRTLDAKAERAAVQKMIDRNRRVDAEKARLKKRKAADAAKRNVSHGALLMRARRQDPVLKEQELKTFRARDQALKLLAKRHHDEYIAIVQERRVALGLPFLVEKPRSSRTQPAIKETRPTALTPKDVKLEPGSPQAPLSLKEQAACQHGSFPLRKLPYGVFCGECGKRIR